MKDIYRGEFHVTTCFLSSQCLPPRGANPIYSRNIVKISTIGNMGSRLHAQQIKNAPPLPYQDDSRAFTREYAASLDAHDHLSKFREEFIIPSAKDLKRKTLDPSQGKYRSTT